MGLNEAQSRSLAVALEHLEKHLALVDRLLERPESGRMWCLHADLAPDRREQLRKLRAGAQAHLVAIADAYDLPVKDESVRQQLAGSLATSWASLEDVRPSTLNRYGPVDPTIVGPLGAALEQLIQLVFTMAHLCQPPEALEDKGQVADR